MLGTAAARSVPACEAPPDSPRRRAIPRRNGRVVLGNRPAGAAWVRSYEVPPVFRRLHAVVRWGRPRRSRYPARGRRPGPRNSARTTTGTDVARSVPGLPTRGELSRSARRRAIPRRGKPRYAWHPDHLSAALPRHTTPRRCQRTPHLASGALPGVARSRFVTQTGRPWRARQQTRRAPSESSRQRAVADQGRRRRAPRSACGTPPGFARRRAVPRPGCPLRA